MEKPTTSLSEKPRVAIIGSGICGTTTAYYLAQKFSDLDITIFEKEKTVGGRTKSIEYEGKHVNLAATFFTDAGLNLVSLMKKFGIEYSVTFKDTNSRMVYDGKQMVYNSTNRFNFIKTFYNYGYSMFKLKRCISLWDKQFQTLYPKLSQNEKTGFAFENPGEFLKFANFDKYVSETGKDLVTEMGLSQDFSDVFLHGMVKFIYSNEINTINGFAMMVILQGMFEKAYTPNLGMDQLIKTMLLEKNDFCNLKTDSPVKMVHFEKESKKYRVQFMEKGVDTKSELFDVVILATPFNFSRIEFSNVDFPPGMAINRQNKKIVITVLEGKIKNSFFGLKNEDPIIESLFLMKGSEVKLANINSISQLSVLGNGRFLYGLQSESPISDGLLSQLFENEKVVTRKTWDFAYPEYKPISVDKIPPFRLAYGLYFPNAIEFTASFMELQTLSAQNIVKLIGKNEGKMWKTKE